MMSRYHMFSLKFQYDFQFPSMAICTQHCRVHLSTEYVDNTSELCNISAVENIMIFAIEARYRHLL